MYKALTEQMTMPESETLGFEERLGLLADREMTERQDRRLKTRFVKPDSSTMPASRTSTTAHRAGLTRPSCCSWRLAAGFTRD